MKKHEGWREGREEYTPSKLKKVLGVRMKRHVITEFLVGNLGESSWITKKEAIVLAEAGKLIATVVHTKGESYLRPKTQQQSFREMVVA